MVVSWVSHTLVTHAKAIHTKVTQAHQIGDIALGLVLHVVILLHRSSSHHHRLNEPYLGDPCICDPCEGY